MDPFDILLLLFEVLHGTVTQGASRKVALVSQENQKYSTDFYFEFSHTPIIGLSRVWQFKYFQVKYHWNKILVNEFVIF